MSPLFMETGYEPNSPGSISAEDCNIQTAGSERDEEGQQVGTTGKKRREKNRDAARKSRKKQTERADELHEELQSLERSNSALQKEIAALKKDLHLYTTALERHEPYCRLRTSPSSSSSSTYQKLSPPVGGRTGSSPPRVPPQASKSTLLPAPLNSSLDLPTHDCAETSHVPPSSSAPTTTTLASPSDSSNGLFVTSSCSPVPYSLSFSTRPAPHSLFSEEPVINTRPTNVMPATTSFVSNPLASSGLAVATHPESVQEASHKTSSLSADASFSTLNSYTLDAFLTKQPSSRTVPPNIVPPYSRVAAVNVGQAQGCDTNTGLYSRNLHNSSLPSSVLPSTQQDAALQSFSVSHQSSSEPFSTPAFALKPSYSQQLTSNPESMLSLLTVPSPLNVPQTISSSTDGPIAQSSLLPPLLVDPIRDISLSELLEVNDWILTGANNQ